MEVTASYPLSDYLVGHDFFGWLAMAKTDGATEILFDVTNPKLKNWTIEEVTRRLETLLKPGCALAGLPYRCGKAVPGRTWTHCLQIVTWYNLGRRLDRLRSVKEPAACRYTVTIRNNHTATARNSNQTAWRQFAEEIGAVVIEDYADQPMHLHDQFALYAGAEMNFGVVNGPMFTLSLTPYPVTMVVNTESARNTLVRGGVEVGGQYPWMRPDQRIVWTGDKLEDLMPLVASSRHS